MRNTRFSTHVVPVLAALALLAAWAAPVNAQGRAVRRPPRAPQQHHPVVIVGGYGPYFVWGPWIGGRAVTVLPARTVGTAWADGPYPYGYRFDELTAAVRLEVKPREAEVYVDGYRAGVVDDFDGIFQRLRLRPGEHDLTIYLAGYLVR